MKRFALIGTSMFLKAVLNFAALVVFARILTPSEYGVYSLVLTLVLLSDAFAFMWLRSSYTRFASESNETIRIANVGHILFLYLSLAAACMVMAAASAFIYPIAGLAPWLWLVIGGMIVGEGVFNFQLSHANNAYREKRFLALSALKSLSALSLGWWLVTHGYGVAGILVGQLIAYVLTALPALKFRHQLKRYLILKPDTKVIRYLLIFGLPLAITGVLESVITASHRSMVFHILGPQALGIYSVSNDLVQKVLVFILLTLNTATMPTIVKALEKKGPEAARAVLRQNAVIFAGLALPVAAGMALFAPHICAILLGEQYRHTAPALLPWFILAALAKGAVSFYLAKAFYLTKSNRKLILPMAAVTALSIVACYLGLTYFGMPSARAAIIGTWILYASVVAFMGHRQFPLPMPWKDWSLVLLATTIMAAVAWPFSLIHSWIGLTSGAAAGGITYALLILGLNVADSRKHLLTASRKIKRG